MLLGCRWERLAAKLEWMTGTSNLTANSPRQWADRMGVWTSCVCVAHCILTPLLLSSSVVLAHFLPAEESIHRTLAFGVALFGAAALVLGFRKHGRRRVLALMGAGLCCIAAGAWFGDRLPSHSYEVAVTMLGSALMITAHRLNHTFCRSCECASTCNSEA